MTLHCKIMIQYSILSFLLQYILLDAHQSLQFRPSMFLTVYSAGNKHL